MQKHIYIGLATALLTSGCKQSAELDVDVVLSDVISTVATATLNPGDLNFESAQIEFGATTDYGNTLTFDLTSEGPYSLKLLGNKADQEVFYKVSASIGSETLEYSDSFETGAVWNELPAFTVDGTNTVDGYILFALVSEPGAVVILDNDGDYVWWSEIDVSLQPYGRARISRDRQSVYYLPINQSDQIVNAGIYQVAIDGESTELIEAEGAHHDFVELENGALATLVYDEQNEGGQWIDGDAILEIAPDGSQTKITSIWDHEIYDPEASDVPGTTWSHANVLDYDEALETYTVSFLGFSSIYRFGRDGALHWRLGGDQSDFALPGGETELFNYQHNFQFLEDSVLIFDNGDIGAMSSRIVEYSFDENSSELEQAWSFTPDPELYCFSLGDATRLDNGNTFANFSVQGHLFEVNPEGEVLWTLAGELGAAFGYTSLLDSLYAE